MAEVKVKVDSGVVNTRKSKEYAQKSEAWAVGKVDGSDVPSTAEQYHNNAKYYKEIAMAAAATATDMEYNAEQDALNSEAYAVGKRNGVDVTSGDPAYHNNSKYFAIEAYNHSADADNAKIDAVNAKNAAASSKLDSEAYAVGTRNGTAVTSGDPAYHNNAKYYKDQAASYASDAHSDANYASGYANQASASATTASGHANAAAGSAGTAAAAATAASNSANAAAASASAIAATYDSTKTYAVGEYCLYNGGMYVCTTAITTAEAWTAGHWSAVKVGTELTALKEDMSAFEYNRDYFNKGECLSTYVNKDGDDATYSPLRSTGYIKVPPYAESITTLNYYELSGVQYRADQYWIALYDADKVYQGKLISRSADGVALGLETKQLPPGTAYVRVDFSNDNIDDVKIFFNYVDLTEIGYNIFKTVRRHDGEGVISNNGSITWHASFGYTDYIPVPKWAESVITYNVATLGGTDYALSDYQFATYDGSKTFIENVHGNTYKGYVETPIDPSTVKYIRIDYGVLNIKDCVCIFVPHKNFVDKWSGKTGDFLGDSLTAQTYYTSKLTSLYGITVNNYGVSGTTISNKVASNYFASRVSGMSTSCDFVFVMGGTNDWGLSAELGDKTDTTANTFYGGLYLMFEALRDRFPTKPIFVSTITQRNWTSTEDQSSGIDSNGNGDSLMDFNDAIVYMAHRYGCVVLDGFGESGICVPNLSTYTSDNLHFNATGGTRFAEFVKDGLERVSPF